MQKERLKLICPNNKCTHHELSTTPSTPRFYRRMGTFITGWNHQPVPRYRCKGCGKTFSSHTFRDTFLQKRPDINTQVFRLYCSGMTQRRIAIELGCDVKTVVRKFLFMAQQAYHAHQQALTLQGQSIEEVQFDEMETFEHTRLKPLSIALAVSGDGTKLIDAQVGVLHFKGRHAPLAYRKYGERIDTSHDARIRTLKSVAQVVTTTGNLKIISDAKPTYANEIGSSLKDYSHIAVPNRRNQTQHASNPTRRRNIDDPLFWLNHVAARIRHDLSRMMRKVWTTSKRVDRLQAHLYLFIAYYNNYPL